MFRQRFAVLVLAFIFCLAASLRGDDSLDDLFEGLPPAESKPTVRLKPADVLPPGEDIELGGLRDPFARIADKMQRSQQALTEGKSQEPTQSLQNEILGDLDALLKNMEKKCAGGNCKKPGSSAGNSSSAGKKPSEKPARDSTARVGESGKTAPEQEDGADTIKEVWGHLPPKVREAMQNGSLEEFLPKYDRLIEEFYRRLAESKQ